MPHAARFSRLTLLRAFAACVALSQAGCDLPEANDLEVRAVTENPLLTVSPSAFGPDKGVLTGGFTLALSLGTLASEDTDVDIQSLKLVAAADQAELFIPSELEVGQNAPRAKHVAVGETAKILYKLSYDKPVDITKLCKAGELQYTGTVFDHARGKAIPIQGATFKPDGCPG